MKKTLSPALGDVLLLSLDLAFTELEQFLNQVDEFDDKHYNKLAIMISKLSRLEGVDAEQQCLAIVQTLGPRNRPKQRSRYSTDKKLLHR